MNTLACHFLSFSKATNQNALSIYADGPSEAASWGLIVGIMVIVALAAIQEKLNDMPFVLSEEVMELEVKRMPYPYRAILDAGVCAGLSWGMGACLNYTSCLVWWICQSRMML